MWFVFLQLVVFILIMLHTKKKANKDKGQKVFDYAKSGDLQALKLLFKKKATLDLNLLVLVCNEIFVL